MKAVQVETCWRSARKLSSAPIGLVSATWGVPVEPQAVMSMAASTARAANGLKEMCHASTCARFRGGFKRHDFKLDNASLRQRSTQIQRRPSRRTML
jgi:hypothetical protein